MERFDKLKDLKIIPQNAVLPNSHKRLKSWKDLSNEERKIESRKMELYAGMIENLDFNIGRIIQYLKEIEEYKNTVIVFMSDNGAAAEDFYNNPVYGPYLKENFTVDYNEMAIEQLESPVNSNARAWKGTTDIMENKKTYKIVMKYKKLIDRVVSQCDKELRRLK